MWHILIGSSLFCLSQALVLSPLNASTHAAMGYVHALTGDVLEAVEMFHKALAIRRDDTFSTTMLGSLMQQLMDVTQPFSNGAGTSRWMCAGWGGDSWRCCRQMSAGGGGVADKEFCCRNMLKWMN